MSEAYDYKPAPHWQGHDFGAARATYDQHVGSSYKDAAKKGISGASLVEASITSKAQRPLVIVVDETGSMGDWPATMFSKLPYLEHEVQYYLGNNAEICFAAIGDAHKGETYALQVRPFAVGADLKKYLKQLVIEGGGGGNGGETYELAALYLARNMIVDPLAEPIVIFIGDEPFFDTIGVDHALGYSKVKLERSITAIEAFGELAKRASIYFIQKPYNESSSGNQMDSQTRTAHTKWANLLGEGHIAMLPDPNRVVDVIFGILAAEVDRIDDFRAEIEGRQTPAQVKMVYKSLNTVHELPGSARKALKSGNSVMLTKTGDGKGKGKPSTPLVE